MNEIINENEYLNAICSEEKLCVELPHTVIISAHPDDEIVGAGGILRRFGKISFIHVTDGSPKDLSDAFRAGFGSREGYAKVRKKELKEAISFAAINPEHLWEIGLVDQEASFNMAGLAIRIAKLLEKVLPCVVLTHAYEGGHPDHDATAFSTWLACCLLQKRKKRSPPVFEFASYHGDGSNNFIMYEFIPCEYRRIWTVVLNDEEKRLKSLMFKCHKSQERVLSMFPVLMERFRKSPIYDFSRPPYEGALLYEYFPWGMSRKIWLGLASEALEVLDIDTALRGRGKK